MRPHYFCRLLICAVSIVPVLSASTSATNSASAANSQATLPVGSCTKTIPCSNGACCNGDTGYCGFGANFCTTVAVGGHCTSNCDAKAQCGPNAPDGEQNCPLNVCCSEFGFCGTTDDFCGTGCQSNCNPASFPKCFAEGQTALTRRIGYYEAWASSRACDAWSPSSLDVDTLIITHLNFAFAYISSSYEVVEMTAGDSRLWAETTALKSQNPSLKVFLSIGGWTFNDPPTQGIFSALAASPANTKTFIKSVLNVMNAYGFDGIDIDWEYPVAEDRGGVKADKSNYVTMIKAIKAAFNPYGYGLSFTAPSSYWYLQNYDLPNMLADDAADWVNVMTYDLHGVWDSPADYIGSIVLAHTNLTQIEMTFQLYANVGVDPSKIVMGMGFYGRSFELVSADCTDPGCPFAGAAPGGPCSANAGILMFTEIEDIISSVGEDALVFDEDAAVKYLVYNDVDWVSYDDQQTLDMKLQYANSLCLGGTMVWSLDQDDSRLTALSALWGAVAENGASSSISGDSCTYTSCGLNCPKQSTVLGFLEKNPLTMEACVYPELSSICCPTGDAPQDCTWRGASTSGDLTCDGSCLDGEITMGMSAMGPKTGLVTMVDGHFAPDVSCMVGELALCCKTNEDVMNYCYSTDCTTKENARCQDGYSAKTTLVTSGGDMEICPSGTVSTLCCQDDIGLKNCAWHGTPPNCMDNGCPVGQTKLYNDYQGDAKSFCVGNIRNYCCDTPDSSTFSPVPIGDVFPSSETDGDVVTFAVDYDDNQGVSSEAAPGAGSSGLSDDGKENDSPFSSVFISSPNAASVSSVDIESDWVLSNCDPTSDLPQTVLAQCSCSVEDDDCGCGHVFIGRVADTIVKLPDTCGLGPYARVASLAVQADQSLASREISDQPAYSLSFDYDFTAIDESNGPVYMRADMTDLPGYWDSVINSPPDDGTSVRKRDFHQPRAMHERRWFGSFGDWLSKLNTLTTADSISRNYHWSDTYTIFHQEEQCPNFESSLDISVTGFASINSQFGYYLEAKIVPPSVEQAYVYFKAGAGATAAFTITGVASAEWDSGRYELVNFGFPGLYYPGLLTLGPSLHLYGELSGGLSLSGSLTASVSYTFPSLDLSFVKQDANAGKSNFGSPVQPTDNYHGFDPDVGWNVQLSGSAEVHLIPSLQLGVSVLGGSLIDAQVFVEADLFAGVTVTGSVSKEVALSVCLNPEIGVNLNAGLTGSVLYWQADTISTPFFSKTLDLAPQCFDSVDEPPDSAEQPPDVLVSNHQGLDFAISRAVASEPAHAVTHDGRIILPTSRWEAPGLRQGEAYGNMSMLSERAIPFLPGNIFCPAVDSDISAGASNCDPYAAAVTPLARRDVNIEEEEPPRVLAWNETEHVFETVEELRAYLRKRDTADLRTCNIGVPIAAYKSVPVSAYYDLANPAQLNGDIHAYANAPPFYTLKVGKQQVPGLSTARNGRVIYGREHVYEQSMASLWIDYLFQFPEIWNPAGGPITVKAFCDWVAANMADVPPYMPANSDPIFSQVKQCYPSLANSANMPVLEQIANVFKQSVLFVTERKLDPAVLTGQGGVVTQTNFQKDCVTLQVATLRTLATITPFMNTLDARNAFIRNNNCVRTVYNTWYPLYRAAALAAFPGATNLPTALDFTNAYNIWVKDIISGMQSVVKGAMETLIPFYNGGSTTAATVKLSTNPVLSFWANLNPPVPANVPWVPNNNLNTATINANLVGITSVATADLTAMKNAVPAVNWVAMLP